MLHGPHLLLLFSAMNAAFRERPACSLPRSDSVGITFHSLKHRPECPRCTKFVMNNPTDVVEFAHRTWPLTPGLSVHAISNHPTVHVRPQDNYAYSGHSPSLWRGALLLPSGCGKTTMFARFRAPKRAYCFSLLLFVIVSLLLFLSATAWEEFFLDSHRYPAATRHLPA